MLIPMTVLLEQAELYGGWSLSVFWLSTVLSLLTLDYLIALPLFSLFLVLIRHSRQSFQKINFREECSSSDIRTQPTLGAFNQ
jgi:hypothetical protein